MENSNIIDVLTIVRCEDAISKYGPPIEGEPTALDPTYAELLTTVVAGSTVQCPNMQLLVPFADGQKYSISWRASSLSLNFDHQCILSSLTIFSTGSLCLSPPQVQSSSGVIYVTDPSNAQNFVTQQETDYLWSCDIVAPGTANYSMYLDVVDHDGNRCGFYQLGGTIKIVHS